MWVSHPMFCFFLIGNLPRRWRINQSCQAGHPYCFSKFGHTSCIYGKDGTQLEHIYIYLSCKKSRMVLMGKIKFYFFDMISLGYFMSTCTFARPLLINIVSHILTLVGGDWNMAGLWLSIIGNGMSSSQLTNSIIFQRGCFTINQFSTDCMEIYTVDCWFHNMVVKSSLFWSSSHWWHDYGRRRQLSWYRVSNANFTFCDPFQSFTTAWGRDSQFLHLSMVPPKEPRIS